MGYQVVMLLAFSHSSKRSDDLKTKGMECHLSSDPIGCVLSIGGTALDMRVLDWTGGTYECVNAHVGAPLGIGVRPLVLFCVYCMAVLYQ